MAANAASWACGMRPWLYVDAVAVALVARRAQKWIRGVKGVRSYDIDYRNTFGYADGFDWLHLTLETRQESHDSRYFTSAMIYAWQHIR